MPLSAAVVRRSATLCTVLSGNRYFLSFKSAPSGKEWIRIFIQTNTKKTNKWVVNMLMFGVDVNVKLLGIRFKNI